MTQTNLTELRSCVITELRTDQIQYIPTFSSGAIINCDFPSVFTSGRGNDMPCAMEPHSPEEIIPRIASLARPVRNQLSSEGCNNK